MTEDVTWVALDLPDLEVGRVTTIVAGGRALCLSRTEDGWGVLDDRCPTRAGRSATASSRAAT